MAPKTKAPKQEGMKAKETLTIEQQPKEQAQPPKEQMQAVSIVLIETNGTIKTLKTKEVSLDTLYKKCGFRVNEDFLCRHTWAVTLKGTKENYKISLWGKKTGKANFENKYDLPPPLDKDLFFGTCALVRTSSVGTGSTASAAGSSSVGTGSSASNTLLDLTKETWQKIYEQLFGGFEDIGDEDEYSEDELANVDPSLLTKDGYLKDDFVVSDTVSAATSAGESADSDTSEADAADSVDSDSDTSEADEEETIKKTKPVKKKVVKKGGKKVKEEEPEDTSELEEEVYTFSDDE